MALLNCVVLNSNEHSVPSTSMLYPEICRMRQVVPMKLGSFTLQWDFDTQFQLIRAERHAALGVKQAGSGMAVAMLACASAESEICWDELCKQHDGMMRARRRPTFQRNQPPKFPWLGISFAPSFFDTALVSQTQQVVSRLATVGLLVLEDLEVRCPVTCT